eukprot:INCI19090.1.p2 GENE.INCI19090.1~~INCI19090.1.p2  ORF type:complete len:231 (-),score=72.10 INCI19090.1:1086-1778(-)
MTTAHKPTWNPAIASKNQGGWDTAGAISHQFSVRDMPQQMTLKKRKFGQGSQSELTASKDELRAKLERKEQAHFRHAKKAGSGGGGGGPLALDGPQQLQLTDSAIQAIEDKFDDSDEFESSSDDSDDSDDDEAEQAALMAELERIKKERQEEARQKEKERLEAEAADKQDSMRGGNPLLSNSGGGALKKKWHDDVVFKNQARDAPVLKKRYINDTVRNDFHRKFMHRYIQ